MDAFADVVGLWRSQVAVTLVEKFDLKAETAMRMEEFGVATPWQAGKVYPDRCI
jgi:hypothetical protein